MSGRIKSHAIKPHLSGTFSYQTNVITWINMKEQITHCQCFNKWNLWIYPLLPCSFSWRFGAIWSPGPPLTSKLLPHDKEMLILGTPTMCCWEIFRFTLGKCVRTDLAAVALRTMSNWCNRTTTVLWRGFSWGRPRKRYSQLHLCKEFGFPAVL